MLPRHRFNIRVCIGMVVASSDEGLHREQVRVLPPRHHLNFRLYLSEHLEARGFW